jgi:hypothetical protein
LTTRADWVRNITTIELIWFFLLWTFHLYVQHSNNYGLYFSQLIRYSRACGSYDDFIAKGLLLTRKLPNQGFLVVKFKPSTPKFYGRHHDLANCYGVYIGITNDHGYVSFVVFTIRPVFHWWLITRCLTRVTRRVWSRNCLHFRLLVDTKYYIMYMYLHLFCDNICYMYFQYLIHFYNFKEVELWTWVVPTLSVEISYPEKHNVNSLSIL